MKKIKINADAYRILKTDHDYYKDRYDIYSNKYYETSKELAICEKELEIYKNLIKTLIKTDDIKDTEMVFYKGKAYRIKSSILTHNKGYSETLSLICNEVNEIGEITIEK